MSAAHKMRDEGKDPQAADLPRDTEIQPAVVNLRQRGDEEPSAVPGTVANGGHQDRLGGGLVVMGDTHGRCFVVDKDGLKHGQEIHGETVQILDPAAHDGDHSIEAHAHVVGEIAIVEAAHVYHPGLSLSQASASTLEVLWNTDHVGDVVSRAGRDDPQSAGYLVIVSGRSQAIEHLVGRAVATGSHDGSIAVCYGLPGQLDGLQGPGRADQVEIEPLLGQMVAEGW